MNLEEQQIGHYRILHLLGNGGMGTVYLATDLFVKRQVAIKIIQSQTALYSNVAAANETARLFRREANAIASLDHPNILPLFDYGEENLKGAILTYMVMPYRQEGSLADWLHKSGSPRPLSPQYAFFILHQAANALQYAHDHQIIHRDVKPSNFLIRLRPEDPAQPDLLLADFGIAKFTTSLSSEDTIPRGTPIYMPPEQWEDHPVFATDQYALAVMMYELLTGRPPFQGNHSQLMYQHFHVQPALLSFINPHLSQGIDSVILRALAKNPNDRFPTIAAFDQAFQQVVSTNNTIHVTLKISQLEAINGTFRPITLPDSRVVRVMVPAGAYDGQIIQVEDKKQVPGYDDAATLLVVTIAISHVNETVEVSHGTTPIEDTLPELAADHDEIPDNNHRILTVRRVLLLILVLLLIVGSFVFFLGERNAMMHEHEVAMATANASSTEGASNATTIAQTTQTAQAYATATMLAQLHATQTAQAQQTAVAIAVTSTAQAQASETPGVLQTAIAVNPVVYQDTLSDASNTDTVAENWENSNNCIFAQDGYHDKESSNWHICAESAKTYQNMAITVDVQILNGVSAGLMFRVNSMFGQYSGYLFEVNNKGQFRIANFTQQFTSLSFSNLQNWKTIPAVLKGNSSYTLEVIANGYTLDFYINGTFVDEEVDRSYTTGKIAFYATSDGSTEANIAYSNLNVYQLP